MGAFITLHEFSDAHVRPQNRNATKQEQTGSMNYSGRGYCGVVCWANLSEDYVRQPATASSSVKSLANKGIISLQMLSSHLLKVFCLCPPQPATV